jgi:hypothetical protein
MKKDDPMTMKFYDVTLIRDGASRVVRVPSPTDAQAADAAVKLATPGETMGPIVEVQDDGCQHADGLPPRTQAEEMAPITPGAAAVSTDRT